MSARPIWFLAAAAIALAAVAPPAQAQTVPTKAFGDLHYRAIGPAIAGGRTTSAVGSNRDPRLYYAGGAGGGVFKSVDGGASWNAVFDAQSAAAIGAIAISPANDDDVWVGTGEANPRNDAESGDGIYHTVDGGKHWTHAGLNDAGAISNISIDPRDPRTVVVSVLGQVFRDSATRGIYVTHDAGAHWTRALYVGPMSGASDVIRLPSKPATLFAGIYQFRRQPWMMTSGGPHGGIYRSDDGGNSWRKLTGNGLPAAPTGRIGLSASGHRVYAIVESREGDLWRSDNDGATWTKMPHDPFVGARQFYFSRIFADPTDPNRVICVSLILSMSKDGGKTFHAISENAGWDYHFVWWSQDGKRLAVGSDEGVTLSSNAGANWWQPYDLPFAQPYHVGLGKTLPGYRVCIGLQDNSSWCGWSTVPNGIGVINRDWETIGPGDGMWALLDPTDPDLVWSTSTNDDTGQVYVWNRRTQQAREVSPYARINADAPSILGYRFNWDTPIAFTNDTPPAVLVGGNVVFKSTDRGEHWTVISPELTRNEKTHQEASGRPIGYDLSGAETSDTILDVEVSPAAAGEYWIGTDDGLVQLTRDAGAHWSNVTPPNTPPWGRVTNVTPAHAAPGTAYVAIDRHMLGDAHPYVYLTEDYGATWRSIASNLPADRFVRSVREDLRDPNLLYAGTQRGVFVSFDRGAHWQSLRLNMPATAIYDIQQQGDADDLVVAAHGRGVWVLDDLSPLRGLPQAAGTPWTLFAPRDAYRMWAWSPVNVFTGGSMPDNEFVGDNMPYGALVTYYLAAPAKHKPAMEILDSNGRVVRHLGDDDLTNVAGLNRVSWDTNEDGPVKWNGTFKGNQGPGEGPEAVPGRYTVRLVIDGTSREQPFALKPDPREELPAAAYVERHDFLAALYAEYSGVDTWLNAIDKALKGAGGARAAELTAFRKQLTFNPRNIEDLGGPQGLRERLGDALSRASSSFAPPNAAQTAEVADLKALYDTLAAQAKALKLVP